MCPLITLKRLYSVKDRNPCLAVTLKGSIAVPSAITVASGYIIVGGAMIVPADGAEGVLLKAAGGGTGTFELGAGAQRSADEASPLPVLEGRLYFLCTAKAPTSGGTGE